MVECVGMDIPLWILLIPLAFIIAFTTLFLFFNVFHLARYGIVGRGAIGLILVYLVSYLFVLIVGATALLNIDWTQTVTAHDLLPFSSGSPAPFGI